MQQRYRGISDPDQEWVLRELIHYLSSGASGAVGFEDMGENWVSVRKAAHDGTLRPGDAAAHDVAERWEQFANYLALSLSQELGATVTSHHPRTSDHHGRLDGLSRHSRTRVRCTRCYVSPTPSDRSISGPICALARPSRASPSTLLEKGLEKRASPGSCVSSRMPRMTSAWKRRSQMHESPPQRRLARSVKTQSPVLPARPKARAARLHACALPADGPEARARGRLIRARDQRPGRRLLPGPRAKSEAMASTAAETAHRAGEQCRDGHGVPDRSRMGR